MGHEEGAISLLSLQGELKQLTTDQVDQVVVHDLLEFPMNLKKTSPETPWFKIVLLDKDKTVFFGTPLQFVDQLVFFLNKNGKIEVIPFSQLSFIEDVPGAQKDVDWEGSSTALDFTQARFRCPQLGSSGLIPTRVLSDPVQVTEFLQNFEQGFEKFYHLKERMRFYAKPTVYGSSTRLGFQSLPSGNPELPDLASVNFKVSSSIPYGLQSKTELLSIQNDVIPFYFPTSSVNFEVKSHLFHGQLIAHVPSLSGGSDYYSTALRTYGEFSRPTS